MQHKLLAVCFSVGLSALPLTTSAEKPCNASAADFRALMERNHCELGALKGANPSQETFDAFIRRMDADEARFCEILDDGKSKKDSHNVPLFRSLELMERCAGKEQKDRV